MAWPADADQVITDAGTLSASALALFDTVANQAEEASFITITTIPAELDVNGDPINYDMVVEVRATGRFDPSVAEKMEEVAQALGI